MFGFSWAVAATIIFVSAVLQATTGFGFALIAVPLLMTTFSPKTAVCTSTTVSLCSLAMIAWRARGYADRHVLRWLVLGSLLGLPLGVLVLMRLDVRPIKFIASAITAVVGCYFLVQSPDRSGKNGTAFPASHSCPASSASPTSPGSPDPPERRLRIPLALVVLLGITSGFLTTSVGMPGPPIILSLSWARFPKEAFRATCSTFFAVVYPVSLLMLSFSGVMTLSTLCLAMSLIPVAMLGNGLGDRLFRRIPQQVFDKAVPLLLILTAANNILSASK